MCKKNVNDSFVFIFDSGRCDSLSYGDVIFEKMLKGKELYRNDDEMIIFLGDISFKTSLIDIEPYVINDKFCSIDFAKIQSFKDYPFCWVIHNLDYNIANSIDNRLKNEMPNAYIGLFKIDFNNNDKRKEFWKNLPHGFNLNKNTIICFQDPNIEDCFLYSHKSKELGFSIKYTYNSYDNPALQKYIKKKTLNIKKKNNRNNLDLVDRDLMQLNFMLCRELQVSGALIWKSIQDIDKINFFSLFPNKKFPAHLVEYSFFTLYHAAQGIERLQKIVVELIYKKHHLKIEEKEKVYNILNSHNHNALNSWINEKESIIIPKHCQNLLNMLQSFYKTYRYYRYKDTDIYNSYTPEFDLLLKLKISNDVNKYNIEIKNNFGKSIGQLANVYFSLFKQLCSELHIFADELESQSSALYAFHCELKDKNLYEILLRKKRNKKEFLYWLIKKGNKLSKYKKIKIQPLDLDKSLIDDYMLGVINDFEDNASLDDEIDELYNTIYQNDKENFKTRLQIMDIIIANPECLTDNDIVE